MKLKKTTPRLKIFAMLFSRSKITGGVISALLCLCCVCLLLVCCVCDVCVRVVKYGTLSNLMMSPFFNFFLTTEEGRGIV